MISHKISLLLQYIVGSFSTSSNTVKKKSMRIYGKDKNTLASFKWLPIGAVNVGIIIKSILNV